MDDAEKHNTRPSDRRIKKCNARGSVIEQSYEKKGQVTGTQPIKQILLQRVIQKVRTSRTCLTKISPHRCNRRNGKARESERGKGLWFYMALF